jgi:lipopolysaccharide/colanic/teichoic acid biosynthesis glycosyltransferase
MDATRRVRRAGRHSTRRPPLRDVRLDGGAARRSPAGRRGSGGSPPAPPAAPPASPYVRWVKPLVDRLGAAVLLVVTLPLMLVVAATVLLALGRPVLLRQRRVGRGGEVFLVWKFRTMLPDRRLAQHPVAVDRRVCHKRDDDPRHTRVGTVLRRWRLDELPQLVNVLAGRMSLVGPRPELVEVVSRHYQPWQHRRHAVKPGLTGLWQISGGMCTGLMHENTHVDLDYVDRIGLRTDVEILLRTVSCLLSRSGH